METIKQQYIVNASGFRDIQKEVTKHLLRIEKEGYIFENYSMERNILTVILIYE